MTGVAYAFVSSVQNILTVGVHTSVNAARTSACATMIDTEDRKAV